MRQTFFQCIIAALFLAASITAVHAQAYPKGPVRLIIPYPPGGATDRIGRLVATGLGKRLGQTIIADNRGGATGTIGMLATVNAPPDGYTLGLGSGGTVAIDTSIEKLPYEPMRDLAAVAPVASIPFIIVVNSAFSPRSISDLIALARKEPGKIHFSSTGTGGPAHLVMEYFMVLSKIKLVHVPYKGAAQAYNDLAGGQIPMGAGDIATALPLIQGGRLRPLAVTSTERIALLPDVPTVSESGLPGYEYSNWFGIFVPVKTPADVIAALAKAVAPLVQEADFRKGIEPLSAVSMSMTRPEFERYIAAETKKRADLIRLNNITIER